MEVTKARLRWTVLVLVAFSGIFVVSLSFLLTDDRMTLALIAVISVIFSVMAAVLLTCFYLEMKYTRQRACHFDNRRVHFDNRFHSGLQISTTGTPISLMAPSQFAFRDFSIVPPPMNHPPSYDESAELENTRVQTFSNAPPAYNHLNTESSNNIASFSPPPFYRPITHASQTSIQSEHMYFSPEQSPSTSRTIDDTSVTRVQSPLPTHRVVRAKRTRVHATNIVIGREENVRTVPVTRAPTPPAVTTVSVPSTDPNPTIQRTRTFPQLLIDCSKAEPTLITINRNESII